MRYLLIIILLTIWNFIFSQEKFHKKIKWEPLKSTLIYPYHPNFYSEKNIDNNTKKYYLSFYNAIYPDTESLLPYYSENIKIKNADTKYNVELNNLKFEPLSQDYYDKINSLDQLKNTISLTYSIELNRGEPLLVFKFIPLRKNNTSGTIEKLVSFTLQMTSQLDKGKLPYLKPTKSYKSQSVLSSGTWIKISTPESGIYSITYSELINMGFNNPSDIRIYGNGGQLLSLENSDTVPDDLINNTIYFETGVDGIFNDGDYILFYGEGYVNWEYDETEQFFSQQLHLYSNTNYYYLASGIGSAKIISIENQATGAATNNVNTFNDYAYHEIEDTNLIHSGREWFGEHFDIIASQNFDFTFPNIDQSSPVFIKNRLIARSGYSSSFTITANNYSENISVNPVDLGSYTSDFAKINDNYANFGISSSDNISVNITYNKSAPSSEGWLDYITINARRNLTMNGSQMHFRDIESVGTGNITNFSITNTNANTRVWDITNTQNVKEINSNFSGSTTIFRLQTDSLREFIAFDGSSFLTPEVIGEVQNQNLHSLDYKDMIIITHSDFLSQANQLADFHIENDGMQVITVTPEQIYNEFSSGKPDVSAIRNFVKMIYNRPNGNDSLKYLLLIGDGSYNNKTSSLILTYQSENSINPINSFVTDDFYGLLDNSDDITNGLLDIGVGRLPVKTIEEAQAVVNKIINYNTINTLGGWKNVVTFVADDEDNNIHIMHADSLSRFVSTNYPVYNIDKIYLDAYQQESTTGGEKYPDVNIAINKRISKGSFIFNYSGHGNERGIAYEGILGINDILSWDNNKLPLFVTATCEFSRFDNHNLTSAGEHVLLHSEGGGVALLSTTRLVFASQNLVLNSNFYQVIFTKDINNNYHRLGDVIRLTKNASGVGINKRNFALLGDPALKLAYPKNNVITTQITNISLETDTLKALSKATISGYVENNNNIKIDNYNGIIYPVVYDKLQTISTLSNDGGPQFNFNIQNNILYKGKASINNGDFSFTFIVPKDISYNYGFGKISYYYSNSDINNDGAGFNNEMIIGGINNMADPDNEGPEINLYLNDENFINGGATDQNPQIFALLLDSSGINTAGNGIGHDITAILDNNPGTSIILNDYYEADIDNYQSGRVIYPLNDMAKGNHNLKFKAWDVYNNSSEESIEFIVVESDGLVLSHVLNYPNPFTQQTAFYFEHNQPNTDIDVLIQIFTLSGKLIKTLETQINTTGFRAEPIVWDGLDGFGDKIGRGVYIYRIKIRSSNGDVTEKYEKLVILK